jgi:hypothetical protein
MYIFFDLILISKILGTSLAELVARPVAELKVNGLKHRHANKYSLNSLKNSLG